MSEVYVTVSAQIPLRHRKSIDEAVKKGEYKNKSEFIRDAVKEKLEK